MRRVLVCVDRNGNENEEIDSFFERFGPAADFVEFDGGTTADASDPFEVTLVLNGLCTHARASVDAAVHATLESRADALPGGLLGVMLDRNAQKNQMAPRLKRNVLSGYARFYREPLSVDELQAWIEDAASARTTRADRIRNDEPVMAEDVPCDAWYSPFLDDGGRRVSEGELRSTRK